jgi:hypothetical protein
VTKPKRSYSIGDKFKLSADALANYGQRYADQIFTVRQWYDHHVKPDQMQLDPHGHPGFDSAAGTGAIYGSELPFDVYEWEMERA